MKSSIEKLISILEAQKMFYIRPDDRILFILDSNYSHLRNAIELLFNNDKEIVEIDEITSPGQNYSLPKDVEIDDKTVCWLITTVSASHSPVTTELMEKKIFLISNPNITPDWVDVLNPANKNVCAKSANDILTAIGGDVGGVFHINDKNGTKLVLDVPNQNWGKEVGIRKGVDTNGPFGELWTAPYNANGILVMMPGDFMTNPINELHERIILTIHNNHVISVNGGEQATQLMTILSRPQNEKAFNLGEMAVQLNPAQPEKVYGSVCAEKLRGGFHVAIGTNSVCLKKDCPEINKFKYGRYSAGVHIDCIHFGANVLFTNENYESTTTIINKGNLQF